MVTLCVSASPDQNTRGINALAAPTATPVNPLNTVTAASNAQSRALTERPLVCERAGKGGNGVISYTKGLGS